MSVLKHARIVIQHALRAVGPRVDGHKRSPHWPLVRKMFLAKYGTCAACGQTASLEVHHVLPFHLNPALELEPHNLITLCLARDRWCHLLIGHGDDYRWYNPNVVVDAAEMFKARRVVDTATMRAIEARAKTGRVK